MQKLAEREMIKNTMNNLKDVIWRFEKHQLPFVLEF